VAFVLVSLLGPRRVYDFDRLLHRGAYAVREESVAGSRPERGWRMLGMTKEFTRGDRIIYLANYIWTFGWFAVFVAGTIINLSHEVSDDAWMRFWKIYLGVQIGMAVVTIAWFTTGGFLDLREMLRRLRTQDRDHADDGFVREQPGDQATRSPAAGRGGGAVGDSGRSGVAADGARGGLKGEDRG
jgi:SSS family solute:Na+ symporter